MTFAQLSALLLLAVSKAEGKAACPFIQAMSDESDDQGAEKLPSLHENFSRKLQPSDASFFVDSTGTGDETKYDLEGLSPSRTYHSGADRISNVPTGYLKEIFKSHRSGKVLTYRASSTVSNEEKNNASKKSRNNYLSPKHVANEKTSNNGKNSGSVQRARDLEDADPGFDPLSFVLAIIGAIGRALQSFVSFITLLIIPPPSVDSVPSPAPTQAPVANPTNGSVTEPTDEPSPYPTNAPVTDPTNAPETFPTDAPVASPSITPSAHPTVSPSSKPRGSPTAAPTISPSAHPTDAPSPEPTDAPVPTPTDAPVDPTDAPVPTPTDAPVDPTDAPVPTPTDAPVGPTDAPVPTPTDAPVVDPTVSPLDNPTMPPFELPTVTPLNSPTDAPVPTPTDAPVSSPTAAPISFQPINGALSEARNDIKAILTGPMAAKFVRLAFHDCIGGCDGCVDTSNPENFGLDIPIDALQPIATKYESILSRADIWVLAAMTAAQETQISETAFLGETTEVVPFDMQFVGRPVCGDNFKQGPDRKMPSPHIHTSELLAFFEDNFGFTARETVAIMGAHTLGVAQSQNSGFDGPDGWIGTKEKLDNNFYEALVRNGRVSSMFRLIPQPNNDNDFPLQYLWRQGSSLHFMLDADMALVADFEGFLDPISGEVSCRVAGIDNLCPDSSTLDIAIEYAESNEAWLNDFHDAFVKMTSHGCDDTICIELL